MAALSLGEEKNCLEADQPTKGLVERAGQYFPNTLLREDRQGGRLGPESLSEK